MDCPYYNIVGFRTCEKYEQKNKQIKTCKYFEAGKCYKDSRKPNTPNKED